MTIKKSKDEQKHNNGDNYKHVIPSFLYKYFFSKKVRPF